MPFAHGASLPLSLPACSGPPPDATQVTPWYGLVEGPAASRIENRDSRHIVVETGTTYDWRGITVFFREGEADLTPYGYLRGRVRNTIVGPSNRGAILTIVDRVSDKC
jgi:hypothetical protein